MTKVRLLTRFYFKLSQLPFFALRNSEVVTLRARQQCLQCAKSIPLRWKRSDRWTRETNQQRKHEISHSPARHVSPSQRLRKIYINHKFEIANQNRLSDLLRLDVRSISLRSFSRIVIKTDWSFYWVAFALHNMQCRSLVQRVYVTPKRFSGRRRCGREVWGAHRAPKVASSISVRDGVFALLPLAALKHFRTFSA